MDTFNWRDSGPNVKLLGALNQPDVYRNASQFPGHSLDLVPEAFSCLFWTLDPNILIQYEYIHQFSILKKV